MLLFLPPPQSFELLVYLSTSFLFNLVFIVDCNVKHLSDCILLTYYVIHYCVKIKALITMEYNSIGSLLSRDVWNLEIVMVRETVYHYLIYRESFKTE